MNDFQKRPQVKKALFFLMLALPAFVAVLFNLSCSATQPTAATNFQNPVLTVVSINTPFTATFTTTATFTPTVTPTNTPTNTSTPYVTLTPWTGFNHPSGVAVDVAGNVYVADTGNNKVGKFTPNGFPVAGWGTFGIKGKVPYTTGPVGVAVDAVSNLYVVGGANQIAKFNANGGPAAFTPAVALLNPQGVAVDGSGNVYISDTGNNRIVQLSSGGSLAGFTASASGTGLLSLAAPITIGSVTITSAVTLSGIAVYNGIVYVATQGVGVNGSAYSSILGFDAATGTTTTIALPGFVNPSGIAFDPSGNLYVADTGNRQVEEFAPNSGTFTEIPVAFNNANLLQSPVGIAVGLAPGFNIFVTDSTANDVVEFTP